ncbi:MAG TPA: 16S rRNA (cytosine(1402)-N(4))-methyltransferase RsmH [Bacteroidales bacterium]|nr:16S rRNA (cytosine(1402)-N(4))-methyltransferase RsmH [Bacteroidales bacterium]
MTKITYHEPVLLSESINALQINPEGIYVDCTFGAGGYSSEILKNLNYKGRLIAFDKDEDALVNSIDDSRFTLIKTDYRFIINFLKLHHALPVDGIIADLGLSSHHIDTFERGFSFRFQDANLDMRMDKNNNITAAYILNNYSIENLNRIFKSYGEIKCAEKIANAVVENRKNKEIRIVSDLINIIKPFTKAKKENQFYAKVFQALRIEVNQELESLKLLLKQLPELLKPTGRALIITYHSLEDRLVKNFFKTGSLEGILKKDFYGNIISPWKYPPIKAIKPTEEEIKKNNRARSAKLRLAIKR